MSESVLEVIERVSGLSPIFARTVIRRAITRAGLEPDKLTAADLDKLLPDLERALRIYVGEDAPARIAAIKRQVGR